MDWSNQSWCSLKTSPDQSEVLVLCCVECDDKYVIQSVVQLVEYILHLPSWECRGDIKSVGKFIEILHVKLRVQRLSGECKEIHGDSACQAESAEVISRV